MLSRYEYEDVPIVVAEAGWTMPEGIAFEFGYRVIFERAAATYVNTRQYPLALYEPGKPPQAVEIATSTGVEIEIEYFLDCIRSNQPPVRAPLDEAALATPIIEFEAKSIAAGGRPVKVRA